MAGRIRGVDLLLGKDMSKYVQRKFQGKSNAHARKGAVILNVPASKTASNVP